MVAPMTRLVRYARVSTADQNRELQLDAVRAAGCTRVFTDYASDSKTPRPQLDRALVRVFRIFTALAETGRALIRARPQGGSDSYLRAAGSA